MPGIFMYRLLFNIIDIDALNASELLSAVQSGVNATLVILAITVGVALPNIVARKYFDTLNCKRLRHALSERKYRQRTLHQLQQK